MSVNQWHWSDAASVYLCHQSALRTTSPQHIGFMQHWGHCSWNVFEGLDLMSQPQEEQKVGRLGLSISPSDIWWTGGFPIMTRFTSNRLRFSSQRNQLRWKNKAREREKATLQSVVKNAYSTRLPARVNGMMENPKLPGHESYWSKWSDKRHPVLSSVFHFTSKISHQWLN